MDVRKRTVRLGTIELRADGILHTIVDFSDEPSPEGAAEYIHARDELAADTNPPQLIEIMATSFVERSIREFMVGNQAATPCRAIVASDPSHATIWKSFQMLDASGTPTKVFATVPRAVQWIREQTKSGSAD